MHNAAEVQALSYPGAHGSAAWFEGKKFTPTADLAAALAQTSATHLLLIQAQRSPSMLKARNASLGSGYLEGLGFYIDRELKMRRSDNGQVGVGFLAPYAYIKLQLINLASGETEREQVMTASGTISAAKNPRGRRSVERAGRGTKDGRDPSPAAWRIEPGAARIAAALNDAAASHVRSPAA